jgi:hypothetical protein
VPGKAVCVVGLKVADPAIVVLELTLEEKVRLRGRRRIVVGGRLLVLERHLKVEIVEVADRNVATVELHGRGHLQLSRAYHARTALVTSMTPTASLLGFGAPITTAASRLS